MMAVVRLNFLGKESKIQFLAYASDLGWSGCRARPTVKVTEV